MPRKKPTEVANPEIRLATTKEREDHLTRIFQDKLAYLCANYEFCRREEARALTFNQSITALKRETANPSGAIAFSVKAHPYIDLMIAADLSKKSTNWPGQRDVERAAAKIADVAKAIRGRPNDLILEHHVHGLMALVKETTGEEARAQRDKNSDYSPQMSNVGGQMIELLFRQFDPKITTTALVNIMRQAQSSGETEGKRFCDYFPFYGARRDQESGAFKMTSGYRLENVKPVYPIYCP